MFDLSLFVIVTIVSSTVGSDLIVSLPDGKIRGYQITFNNNNTFYAFQQIPYAAPPLNELRFQPPQPVKPWTGILNCTETTTICYQVTQDSVKESEDCLHLSVYTPVKPGSSDEKLPVMFYIYGGGFIMGSNNFLEYGPHYFMPYNVVIVAINYRVGPFGFLSTGDSVVPGNNGLKDQNMALKWVQKNIEYFGGDPKMVTIFGQSAGAASVTYQMMSRKSDGLFRGAIAQSGSALCPWAYQRDAPVIAKQLVRYIDGNFSWFSNSTQIRDFLLNASAKEIDVATTLFPEVPRNDQLLQGYFFAPVIEPESEHAFITQPMFEALREGKINKVPLMIGYCSEEQLLRALNYATFPQTINSYESDVSNLVPNDMHINLNIFLRWYLGGKIRSIYTDDKLSTNFSAAVKFFSDSSFNRPIRKFAELASNFTDVYFYQFSYHGLLGINPIYVEGADRVTHNEDRRYLWTNFNITGTSLIPQADLLTLDRYLTLFTNFAKYLNPTPDKNDLFQDIIWPKVTPNSFSYLNINNSLSIDLNPKDSAYQKWVELYNLFAIPPLDTY